MLRQVVLDTETTGREVEEGHRIIEIGALELIDRRRTDRSFHTYLSPGRPVDPQAQAVHGLSDAFLADKPPFGSIVDAFLAFIDDAELVIHNAPFDTGFLDAELARLGLPPLAGRCRVLDTLALARRKHPGQRNSLDALCRRYQIDNSGRTLHGALLDAELLTEVYLAMTGGQVSLALDGHQAGQDQAAGYGPQPLPAGRPPLLVLTPSAEECAQHQRHLAALDKAAGGACVWRACGSVPS